jgi:hypothetical protein
MISETYKNDLEVECIREHILPAVATCHRTRVTSRRCTPRIFAVLRRRLRAHGAVRRVRNFFTRIQDAALGA